MLGTPFRQIDELAACVTRANDWPIRRGAEVARYFERREVFEARIAMGGLLSSREERT